MNTKEKIVTNTINIVEQKDGSFKIKCPVTYLPLDVAQEILNNVIEQVKYKYSSEETYAELEFHKFRAKTYRILYYSTLIMYVIVAILSVLKRNGVL